MSQHNVPITIRPITDDFISSNNSVFTSSLTSNTNNSKNVLLLFSDDVKSDKIWDIVTRTFNYSDNFIIKTSEIFFTNYNNSDNNSFTNSYGVDSSSNSSNNSTIINDDNELNNWWAMLAVVLVIGTAAGNILVCLAISWERRLQNVTNYFLMSLAITDLMVY